MSVPAPPERLDGAGVVLVRVGGEHTAGIHEAKARSHRELWLWMDWAGEEPDPPAVATAFVERAVAVWDAGTEFTYAITAADSGEVIGGCGIMTRRGPGRLEIGYWVRTDRAGAGVATEAARLATDAAFGITGIETACIHHDAANEASGRVAEKLGYRTVDRFATTIDNAGESGVEVVWELSRAGRP